MHAPEFLSNSSQPGTLLLRCMHVPCMCNSCNKVVIVIRSMNFDLGARLKMAAQAPAQAPVPQVDVRMGAPVPVQPLPTPMEISTPAQGAQMDLKALLEDHILERPLENAFHG